MSRTADYTIQGFIYQFIVTLHKILLSDSNSEIQVEGLIEDIDVVSSSGIEATQCKYHEEKDKFTLSAIYKPVLQMMCHYNKNTGSQIKYKLYAHFPTETVGSKKTLSSDDIVKIVGTKDASLEKYVSELTGFSDGDNFSNQFEIEFGASLADLQRSVIVSLSSEGFSTEDAEEIFYPNAIHQIAELSINHNATERKITKAAFITALKEKRKTVITRWTKELQSYDKLLKKRREQMRDNLNKNSRTRAVILDSSFVNNFDSTVVRLIEDFVNKYNCKIKLHQCPLFSLICEERMLNTIWRDLITKKITVERGLIAGQFDVKHFLREPMKLVKEGKSEFKVRLCLHDTDFQNVLTEGNFDDLLIFSNSDFGSLNIPSSIAIEKIETQEINEIKYLLSISNSL